MIITNNVLALKSSQIWYYLVGNRLGIRDLYSLISGLFATNFYHFKTEYKPCKGLCITPDIFRSAHFMNSIFLLCFWHRHQAGIRRYGLIDHHRNWRLFTVTHPQVFHHGALGQFTAWSSLIISQCILLITTLPRIQCTSSCMHFHFSSHPPSILRDQQTHMNFQCKIYFVSREPIA